MHFLHRYAGLTAAFFALFLSITGILLNHTEALKLYNHNATSPWLLALYGIKAPDIKIAYELTPVKNNWVVEFGEDIYLNNQALNCKPPLIGAISTNELLIIGNKTQLCLYTPQGELIDYLYIGRNKEITRLGKSTDEQLIIDTPLDQYTLNEDYTELVSVSKDNDSSIDWKLSTPPPFTLTTSLAQTFKGKGLPWERVILDLHSGRIAGLAGVYFMDFIGLLIVFLAISGILMWLKHSRHRRKRKLTGI